MRPSTMSPRPPRKRVIGNAILFLAFVIVLAVVKENLKFVLSRSDESRGAKAFMGPVPQEEPFRDVPFSLDDESIHTFVVWTYPTTPAQETDELSDDQVLLCSYPPCRHQAASQRLNLKEIVQGTPYQDFLSNHTLHKLAQSPKYLHHVQSIALLSLVQQYPTKCAQTWGDDSSHRICASDLSKYAQYNPLTSQVPIQEMKLFKEELFHVLSYDSRIQKFKVANMEDELQTLAAAQFYPHVSSFVDRDQGLTKVDGHLIANARFRTTFALPKKSLTDVWETTFLSLQIRYDAESTVKNHQWLFQGYNDKEGAIGAEDIPTLDFLREQGISSYLALSFTVMLGRNVSPNRTKTVIVDVKPGLLPPSVETNAIQLKRLLKEPVRWKRLEYADKILNTYATQAKVVITSRIQLAMPAVAMGIPVIYVGMADYLEGNGVGDMLYSFDPYKGETWTYNLNKQLPPKAGLHRADRARASFWNVLKRSSPYYTNTAYLYGMVPFRRLGRAVPDEKSLQTLFHFAVTTPTISWREKRAVENVFFFHPNAQVIVHSNTLRQGNCELDVFAETGYDLHIRPYDLKNMLQTIDAITDKKLVDLFISNLSMFATGEHWYSHETDILRYMLLWKDGGVYLDTDMHLIKPLAKRNDLQNIVAYQDPQHDYVSGGVMIFEPRHQVLQGALQWILENYKNHYTEWPVLGSSLMTLLSKDETFKDTFQVLDDASFYPIDWESIEKCFTQDLPELDLSETFAVHLNTKITAHHLETIRGTLCDKLLHAYCIFCDEVHTIKREEADIIEQDLNQPNDGVAYIGQASGDLLKKPKEQPKKDGPSFISKLVSGIFGGAASRPKKPQSKPVGIPERKYLPPVHMEFVKKKD